MNEWWLEFMKGGGTAVWELIERHGDRPATAYQFKWNVVESIATRSVSGRLTHLRSQESAKVRLKLPI